MRKKVSTILLAVAVLVGMLSFTGMDTAYAGAGMSVKVTPAKVFQKSVRDTAEKLTAEVNGGTAPYTYQWQKSSDPAGTKKDISGATEATYTPKNAAGSTFYSVTVKDSTGAVATSDAVHVKSEATVPDKKEIKASKSWYYLTVKLSSPLKLGGNWRAVAQTAAQEPAKIEEVKGSKAISKSGSKYVGSIKISNLKPNTSYYIYTCTYSEGYSANMKSKETKVSKWSDPVLVKTTKIPAPKSLKITVGKKKMTVKWKAMTNSRIKGYQISYKKKGSTKAKTVKIKKRSAAKKVIKKLKKGKKYVVKIRAYAVISGKTYYGKWSKSVTTKKIK